MSLARVRSSMLAFSSPAVARTLPFASGEICAITYLRWYAAFSVLVFHVGEQINRSAPQVPRLFALRAGVDVFFAISGFVMVYSTGAGTRMTAGRFLLRRIERIVPLYWLVTLVLAGALVVVPAMAHSGHLSWVHLVCSLLFLPARHPGLGLLMPVVVPGWTLNYEMFFYAVFALALALGRGHPARVLTLAVVPLLLLALIGTVAPSDGIAGFYASPLLGEFVLGMGLALVPLSWRRLPAAAGLGLAVLVMAILLIPRDNALTMSVAHHVLVIGVPAAALAGLAVVTPLRRIDWLCLLGDSSYALYLSQALTVPVIAQALIHTGMLRIPGGAWLALVLASGIGLGCGVLCHLVVEQPLVAAARKVLRG